MRRAWARFEQALRSRGIATGGLASPAASSELEALEAEVGGAFPQELRQHWQVHDGEAGDFIGLAGGFRIVPTAEARKICSDWAAVRQRLGSELKELDRATSSHPPQAIRRKYSLRGWVPVLRDHEGNYVGVDLDPGPEGTRGQIINFGRVEDDKRVLFDSIVALMEWLAQEVEEGRIVFDEVEQRVRHVSGRLVAVVPRGT
jgi:cell wall assembly regulator SMI1